MLEADGYSYKLTDGLIEMKKELGREKDLKDIALLKAYKEKCSKEN